MPHGNPPSARRAIRPVSVPESIHPALAAALALQQQGNLAQAGSAMREHLQNAPDDAAGHAALASLLQSQGDREEARTHYEKALSLDPDYVEVACNLGGLLRQMGDLDASADVLRRALRLRPNLAEAWTNLGLTLTEMDEPDQAIETLRRSLAIRPDLPETHFNLANALAEDDRLEEAMQSYRDALALRPGYPDACWNLSHALLLSGRFREGWDAFEARWQIRALQMFRPPFTVPCWNGEDVKGKTLFIYAEQGFGDTLQFVRYAPLACGRGAKVILHVQRELLSLVSGIEGAAAVRAMDAPAPQFDYHCPVMSLPRAFRTDALSIPANVPYLRADPDKTAAWRVRLPRDDRLKVGLVWSSGIRNFDSALFYADLNRSVALRVLEPLSRVKNVDFHGLQKGDPAREIRDFPAFRVADWSDELRDFGDTAALLDALDLVISVDTAVAHLAGALGKSVWVLVQYHGSWRWQRARADSPWYPGMRLFRQSRPNDWRAPVEAIAVELARLASEKRRGAPLLRFWQGGRA